jgi:hypothetical protein
MTEGLLYEPVVKYFDYSISQTPHDNLRKVIIIIISMLLVGNKLREVR